MNSLRDPGLAVALGLAVLVCDVVARRIRIAPPVVLLVCGALLGFVPALRSTHLPPSAVLLLFLPALLYSESLTTSLREIRRYLRLITLLSTVLIAATAAAVAVAGHAFGLLWGPAWVLGAALAPTDATAVGVLARALPRRTVTLLRAESLVNDGTALVIYGLAVGVTTGEEHLSVLHVSGLLLLSYAGGAAAGVVTAWVAIQVRRRLDDPQLNNLAALLTPFTAFLAADAIHASGVLAVVVCGLIMSQTGPRVNRASTRQQSIAFWSLATFVLNGALFVLIGLQLQSSIRGLTSGALTRGLILVVVVSAALIGVRFAWLFTTPYVIRLLDRRPQQRLLRMGARGRTLSAVAGFRGAVSLAAVLAVPQTLHSGRPFPDRDLIVFVAAGVIAVTLAQALLLPAIVRWARLPQDSVAAREEHLAQTTATQEVLDALPRQAAELHTDPEVTDRLRREYTEHLHVLRAGTDDPDDEPAERHDQQYAALRLAGVAHKRATMLRLRDEQRIDDTVLSHLEDRLDLEELRLSQEPEPAG
ncbi:MAG TPA: Na+/H+ antiporter [Streptosporangiaceae bacterium]